MCNKKIQTKIPNINSKIKEIFKNDHVNIPYTGPTIPEETALMPTPLAKTKLESLSFEQIQEFICDRDNFIETKGNLKVGKLSSGPYETFGGTLEFKRLHFHFDNLVIPIRLRYYFNKSKICEIDTEEEEMDISENDIQKDVSGRNFGSIIATIEKDISGILFENYFCSDGEDIANINKLFYDLEPFFANYSSNFGVFFDVFMDPIMDQSLFAKKIHRHLIKVYCENLESQPKNVFVSYQEKIQRVKQLGWMDVISTPK
jgi:hypothetical protein